MRVRIFLSKLTRVIFPFQVKFSLNAPPFHKKIRSKSYVIIILTLNMISERVINSSAI
jgi:hypothetical protein